MTRLFLKILGLFLVTHLVVIALGFGLIKWLEHERVLISPGAAPQVLAEQVVKAWQQNQINSLAKDLKKHGTYFALLDGNRELLYTMPELKRFVENRGRVFARHHEFKPSSEGRPKKDNRRRSRPGFQFTLEVNSDDGATFYVISRSRHPLKNYLPRSRWQKYFPWLAGILGILIASSLLSFYITRPILSLRKTTQSLGQRDLSARVETKVVERQDAIGELGRDFNRMATRLDESLRSQHQLLRDISHELRSPLARIQIAGTLAEQKTGSSSELARIEQETQRLDRLIETILRLTRLNDMPDLVFEPLDLTDLINDIVHDARYEYQKTDKTIEINLGKLPDVNADYENLSSAIENIVRNAMHYTDDSSTVTVSARATPNALEIQITDQGPGVPEADLTRLFEPFFRSDISRNEKTGSNGVGLAITHRIIELHGGKVWASNSADGGLIITIHLPLSDKTDHSL